MGVSLAQNLIDALESAKNAVPGCKIDTDLSKSNIKLINKKAVHNISLESINNVSALLNSASDLTNSSSAEKKITEALALLEALNTSNIQATSNLDIINNQSTATLLILQELSNKLDILIADLGSANVVGADKIVSPIGTKIESITTSSKNKDYIIPALIAIIALFGGILLSSTFVLQERKSKAYFRKFLTPTSDFTFLFGSYLTCLIILVVQFVLVLIGIAFILNTPLAGILPQIALILFLALSAFTFIGMFIGYLFKSEETTIFAGVLISALLMFFSNTLLPLETMSEKFRSAALFNPLVAVDTGLKKVMLFGLDLSSIANELYILAGFFVVFAVLSYFGRRITKKML